MLFECYSNAIVQRGEVFSGFSSVTSKDRVHELYQPLWITTLLMVILQCVTVLYMSMYEALHMKQQAEDMYTMYSF